MLFKIVVLGFIVIAIAMVVYLDLNCDREDDI